MERELPVLSVLGALRGALIDGSSAVLVAPPGAGKTTAVAPALLKEAWCAGQILLLSPRRLAARAAAERMACTRVHTARVCGVTFRTSLAKLVPVLYSIA